MPRGSDRGEDDSSRLARWRASWRVALRMARRDLRRHKGRSILVFLMVAVPVGLLAGAATLGATEQADGADLTTARMGSGQALVQGPQVGKIQQSPDPNQGGMGWSDDNRATGIPGFAADGSSSSQATAVGRLVGGTAVAVGETQMRLVVGDRRVRITGLVADPRAVDLGDKARLGAGSWGAGPDEIVITPAGERKGLPRSGSVTLSAGGTERTVRVVGTATALLESGGMPDFVVPSMPADAGPEASGIGGAGSWVVLGSGPVSWEDVQRLNTYGLTVFSRAVLADPPPDSALPPELRAQNDFTQDTGRMIAVIGGVMLFILTTLLVGPAFAVSAARQRRTLALAATNGAETRQLRRTVLAQALVLGVLSALGGVLLGVAAVRVGLWWWVRTHPDTSFASLSVDLPWGAFAILVPCAVLSAVVAALLPSLRLGRLDVIGVMRGQSVSPKLNKVVPVVGLVLAVVGGAVVLSAARPQSGGELRVAFGAVGLVLGTLLLVPAILVAFGRLASRLPVAPRIATRDAARHRSRSTPTVAAILAGVVALTAFSIGLASDTKQQMAEYTPQALPGEGTIYTGDAETRLSVEAALRELADTVRTTPLLVVRGQEDPLGPPSGTESAPVPFVAALPEGCTLEESIVQSGPDGHCVQLGTMAYNNGFIGVLPAADIAARLHLTGEQRRVVEQGGIAVAVPAVASGTSLRLAHGTFVMDQQNYTATQVAAKGTDTLPVVPVPPANRGNGAMPQQTGAFVTPDTAKRLGWPTYQAMVLLHAPDGGPIDQATEKRLDERVGDEGGLYVERGFQRYDETVMRIMMGVAALLLLIVTLISTALSMAEQQADSGTLAAVGATRRTRRAFAASQAIVVGFLGAVLGIAVGLVPGIAITYPLTTGGSFDPATGVERMTGPYLSIPWTPLLLVVLGVPLLAGLLSAVAIRRAPALTRRAD
jgi:putative ABC transport system permease protein